MAGQPQLTGSGVDQHQAGAFQLCRCRNDLVGGPAVRESGEVIGLPHQHPGVPSGCLRLHELIEH
ncbi:hypothetical protein AWN90_09210 [Nocardia terpenica]|uniref:Uncharacterized protein n=1 Tax=Nocardia terpenica TaxID=455432 RepID=A0A164H0Y3_9NOCA|nr:hypothetical protein AWN90_09210 [Nocardia terpenica]